MFLQKNKQKFLLSYTGIFIIASVLIFGNFFFHEKSILRYSDSLNQYFYSLCYYAQYLRKIVSSLFVKHTLSIPMWDLNIGMGSDILTTLHYYVIGDPLNLLSIFFTNETMEYLFCGLIILRLFLAGLAFSKYCFYHAQNSAAILLGSVIYCFSGWSLLSGLKYPSFINPLIYLPLLLLGIDKIYHKEKPYLFIFMTALSAISSFYFFYMLCIFMFIYAAFCYFRYENKLSVRAVLSCFMRFLGYYLIGLCLSSFILLPNLAALLSSQRVQIEHSIPLVYTLSYYLSIPLNLLIFWDFAGCGYTPFFIPALIILLRKTKEYMFLRLGLFLLLFLFCIPYFGHFINGFSYISNRWTWALSFLIAYIFVKTYPNMFKLAQKEIICLCSITLVCIPLWYVVISKWYLSLFSIIITVLFIAVNQLKLLKNNQNYLNIAVYILILSNILINFQNIYLDKTSSQSMQNNIRFGQAGSLINEQPSSLLSELSNTETGYRYDQNFPISLINMNSSILQRTNSLQFYFSLANGYIADYFNKLYVNAPCDFLYSGLDSRSILNTIASVKYCLAENDSSLPLPWGYKSVPIISNAKYSVYETDYALPIGYTYSTYLPLEEWEKLDVVQRQYSLLQSVVIPESTFPRSTPVYNNVNLNYKIAKTENITFLDNNHIKTVENSSITITTNSEPNSETYLILSGLDFNGKDSSSDIKITVGNYNKSIRYFTKQYDQYSGKHNFICNLGYHENPFKELTITFDKEGVYSFDKLSIVSQPTDDYPNLIKKLQTNCLENIQIANNSISGTIELEKPQILCLSIPYSKGWKILVDGKEKALLPANIMFMATELPAGSHLIELQYKTPFALLGLFITLCGVALLIIYHRFSSPHQ